MPRTRRPLPTGPDRIRLRQHAARLYADGCTVRSIAHQIGRPYTTTYALLREAHVAFRPRGRTRTSIPAADR